LTDEPALAQATHCLQPAEDLLDPLALPLADSIALVASRSTIETGCSTALDTRDVGYGTVLPEMVDETARAVGFVRTQGQWVAMLATLARQHVFGRYRFVQARIGHGQVDTQSIAVIHQGMATVRELRRLAIALAHELGLGIGAALMRLVRAALALEVDHSGAVTPRRRGRAIFWSDAFQRRPGFDQRTVDRVVNFQTPPLATVAPELFFARTSQKYARLRAKLRTVTDLAVPTLFQLVH